MLPPANKGRVRWSDGPGQTTLSLRRVGFDWMPRFLRGRLTPMSVASAIGSLAIAIAWVLDARHDLSDAEADIKRLQTAVAESAQDRLRLSSIEANASALKAKVDDSETQVERLQDWHDKIEELAEAPPHARKRH